jgi:DNA-binding GntR family transcriptional regulator
MSKGGIMDLKVSTQSIQNQVVRNLREAIISGMFQPGDRLVEADMCARLGVSRPSLREALRSLEAERLLVIVPKKGSYIPSLTLDETKEIYETRALLEGEAVALFASRVTEDAIAAMTRALADFDLAVKQELLGEQIRATRQFYEQILSGCGHRTIHEMLNMLTARITFLRSKSMSQPGRAENSSREMKAILLAIVARNPESARAAAIEHVKLACRAVTEVFLAESACRTDRS